MVTTQRTADRPAQLEKLASHLAEFWPNLPDNVKTEIEAAMVDFLFIVAACLTAAFLEQASKEGGGQ